MHFVKTHEIEFDTFPYLCQMMSQSPSQLSGFGASNFYTQGISPTSTGIYIVYKIITISVYQICVFTIQGKKPLNDYSNNFLTVLTKMIYETFYIYAHF